MNHDRQVESPATRIGAIVMRHVYILRRSWPRILELAYWPTLQMIMRRSMKNIYTRESYLSGLAHPPVFSKKK